MNAKESMTGGGGWPCLTAIIGLIVLPFGIVLGGAPSLDNNETGRTVTAVGSLPSKKSPAESDQRHERTFSARFNELPLKAFCDYYSSEMISRKVNLPLDAKGSVTLIYDDLTLDQAKRAIADAFRKIGYAFRDELDGSVSVIRIPKDDK